jgi:hypothetical protein
MKGNEPAPNRRTDPKFMVFRSARPHQARRSSCRSVPVKNRLAARPAGLLMGCRVGCRGSGAGVDRRGHAEATGGPAWVRCGDRLCPGSAGRPARSSSWWCRAVHTPPRNSSRNARTPVSWRGRSRSRPLVAPVEYPTRDRIDRVGPWLLLSPVRAAIVSAAYQRVYPGAVGIPSEATNRVEACYRWCTARRRVAARGDMRALGLPGDVFPRFNYDPQCIIRPCETVQAVPSALDS